MSKLIDAQLRELTGYTLRRATTSVMPAVNRVLEPFGLRRITYSSLVIVVRNPGLNQSQLADALAVERPNLVQIVDEMERDDLLSRERSAFDRRAYALSATEKGAALEGEATKVISAFEAAVTAGLSAEQVKTLHKNLEIIEANAAKLEKADERQVQTS